MQARKRVAIVVHYFNGTNEICLLECHARNRGLNWSDIEYFDLSKARNVCDKAVHARADINVPFRISSKNHPSDVQVLPEILVLCFATFLIQVMQAWQ